MSEQLALQTLSGIYDFCGVVVKEEDVKFQILNHINTIFQDWPESWIIIKKWLKNIQFQNKEQDLLDFFDRIPELRVFQSVILVFLSQNSEFWDTVYENLQNCRLLLNRE